MDSVEKILQIVSAMESRVQDDDIKALDRLLSKLSKEVKGNTASYVKMMRAIGRYLTAKGGNAHSDTVPVLAALALDLETLAGDPSPEEAGEILARGIRSFKSLKARAAGPHVSEKDMEELKAVVLSIDWEISPITLRSFDRVLTGLKEKVKSGGIHFLFLRIIHAVGGDIARNKADAHNDSITLLRSVLRNFERLVRHPDMAPEEKKQLIEGDIRAYNAYKRSTFRPAPPEVQPDQDADVAPALSHVTSAPLAGDSLPLNTLPEPSGDTVVRGDRKKADTTAPPRDVMGDLFSPKASPADELLDVIHLAEVHGESRAAAMMRDSDGQETGDGIKNLTPQRPDKTPIPEIESRLDAFFNQGVIENSNDGTPDENDPETDPESEDADFVDADLIPEPDASVAQIPDGAVHSVVPVEEDNARAQSIIDRLQVSLGSPAELTDDARFTQVLENLYHLKQLWFDDVEKSSLLTLLAGLSHYIHDLKTGETEEKSVEAPEEQTDQEEIDDTGLEFEDEVPEETDTEEEPPAAPQESVPEEPGPATNGIFAKMKSMFRN